jgi:hypothetical protein
MRLIGAALLAALAVGCTSASPTSPSALDTTTLAAGDGTDAAPLGRKAATQKITLYVFDNPVGDDLYSGKIHIVGLHIIVTTSPSALTVEGDTGKQGEVTFWIPATERSIAITNGYYGVDGGVEECFVSRTVNRDLPMGLRENWILVTESNQTNFPSCQ